MSLSHWSMYGNEQLFTFVNGDGKVYHVAVDRLNSWLWELGFDFLQPFDTASLYAAASTICGADEDYARTLPDEALEVPVSIVILPDNTHMLVDGAHRVLRQHWAKRDTSLGFLVPWKLWSKFTVHDLSGSAEQWNKFNSQPGRLHAPIRPIYT